MGHAPATETRIGFILINTVIILTGTGHFYLSLPILCGLCLIGLIIVVKRTSDQLWEFDMAQREALEVETPAERVGR